MVNQGSETMDRDCPECSECEGASHHWFADPWDQEDEGYLPGDYGCKHCDMRGDVCWYCNGEGCDTCDGEGVIELEID